MREIEKSVYAPPSYQYQTVFQHHFNGAIRYIAADVELLRCDVDDSKEYGKLWGGASAGDIVGVPRVRAAGQARLCVVKFYSYLGMSQCANGSFLSSRASL